MLKGMPDGILERLESMANPRATDFQAAWWLDSPFSANTWVIRFGEHVQSIEWAVPFGNGCLTDLTHWKMLDTFKSMVTSQTHPAAMRGRICDVPTTQQRVYRAFRLVDFFLLQQEELKLAKYGFDLVTENDFDRLLLRCGVGPTDEEVIYRWTERLAEWLDERVNESYDEIILLLNRHKVFSDITIPAEEWTLTKDPDRLASWRAALWLKGMYRVRSLTNYRFIPFTTKLAEKIYGNTIFGQGRKSIHEELCLYPSERYQREYPAVDVRTIERSKPSWRYVRAWRSTILSMSTLESVGFDVPTDALNALRENSADRHEGNPSGRYRNPPFWQVLDGIKNGVEFALDHGEALLDSYVNIMEAAKAEKVSPLALIGSNDVQQFLTKGALDLGVTAFCLRGAATGWPSFGGWSEKWDRRRFFEDLRNGRGLLQNLHVLYGAIIHVIGPITARRQMELVRLPVIGCLDASRKYMVFRNAKSGALGLRQEEVRPIPPIVEQMVSLLESFQSRLVKGGSLNEFGSLLSMPGSYGMRVASSSSFNASLDVFCDYFDTPLNANGHRYYLREHQFRRFLIITFFFGARQGNLNTLRWFVGHVDAAHLWHYLTNAVSGDMRREAAAYFLMDELRLPEEQRVVELHEQVRQRLRDFAESRFGASEFSFVDGDALEDYLNLQMKKGLVVEPVFLPGAAGRQYKIVARIGRSR
ncbi:hypothetical protein [Pandoraea anhela]|uniref:Integrase n=1 Tax=Pandoraea anhela TaxID=2508295 RepID=A0A5E4XH51_9BURK|nr:hypothetical protein [Pandoraea anhela]VVE35552.1 hypothetical protein PAN31108_03863 [Pandoraea anhela]